MKTCARCKISKPANEFPRDARKVDGYAYACKECKTAERKAKKDLEVARWKRYYAPGSAARKRHIVRSQTRRKYGSAKYEFCVLCGEQASEWHHLAYLTDGAVPLCHVCHEVQP